MNREIPDVQAGFRKGRGTRDQIANIHWIIEKAEFQKNIYLCFTDYAKAFDCVDHNKLWEILKEMGMPDCREPPREISPMTRSCGRELLSKASGLNGLPRLPRTFTPKPESVCFTISWLSPTPLTLTGGYLWPPFSGENQLRALANKSSGHERNISIQTPSVSILACLAALSRLFLAATHMIIYSLLTVRGMESLKHRAFQRVKSY